MAEIDRIDARHHITLDVGLDRAGGFDGLQDHDEVARPDAERVESVDDLLQRYAFLQHGELAAFLLDADASARGRRRYGRATTVRADCICGASDIDTVRLPCATATVDTRARRGR